MRGWSVRQRRIRDYSFAAGATYVSSTNPLRVVIGCDTDPDRADFGGIPFDKGDERQIWRGVECIPAFRERLDEVVDSRGRPLAVTWLLRCDEQIKRTEGSAAFLMESYQSTWRRCEASGDEIGWHPHFWRLAADSCTWFHETRDADFQRDILREGFEVFRIARGVPPRSVRMGWDFHTNDTMNEISRLGVSIDFSALPRQRFGGSYDDRGASFAGAFDWSHTGTAPYHPSRDNYQLPGDGDCALPIIELPLGLLRSRFVGFLGEARRALRDRSLTRAARALLPGGAVSHTTVKACAPPILFRAMVADILSRHEDWLATYFHPDELLPTKGQIVNSLIHRADYFLKNARNLVCQVERSGRHVEFVTAAEAADILSQ
jgi:hypothetical protein